MADVYLPLCSRISAVGERTVSSCAFLSWTNNVRLMNILVSVRAQLNAHFNEFIIHFLSWESISIYTLYVSECSLMKSLGWEHSHCLAQRRLVLCHNSLAQNCQLHFTRQLQNCILGFYVILELFFHIGGLFVYYCVGLLMLSDILSVTGCFVCKLSGF